MKSIISRAVEHNNPKLAAEALREIDALLVSATDPDEKTYLTFSKVSCYAALGEFGAARSQLDYALNASPGEDAQLTADFMQALLLQQEDKPTEAFAMFTVALSKHSDRLNRPEHRFLYEDIQQRRAFLLVKLRRFQDAILMLTETLSHQIDEEVRSDAFAALGLCHLELKEYILAKDYLLQAVGTGLSKRWEGQAHFYLGIAYFYCDLLPEAEAEFLTCEKLAAQYDLPIADIYAWLSATFNRLGEVSEAKRYATLRTKN